MAGRDMSDMIERYLDGELSADEHSRFQAELSRNAVLKSDVDAERLIRQVQSRPLPHHAAPGGLPPAVMAKLSTTPAGPFVTATTMRGTAPSILALGLTVVLAVLVGLGLGFTFFQNNPEPTTNQPSIGSPAPMHELERNSAGDHAADQQEDDTPAHLQPEGQQIPAEQTAPAATDAAAPAADRVAPATPSDAASDDAGHLQTSPQIDIHQLEQRAAEQSAEPATDSLRITVERK